MSTVSQPVFTPEVAVGLRDLILHGLDMEFAITGKVVAAIPENSEYRPDPKARTAQELAWHLVNSEVQMLEEVADLKFTMEPRFADEPKTVAAMRQWYEQHFPAAVARVRKMTSAQLLTPVDFYGVMKLPVFQYLPMIVKHSVHHRGQLATYLRPMGSKVPGIYGGSADEPWEG
jgi:uncharacterized damage-inducible protein DinB